jgi:uncharacterized integral membrane protein
MKLAQMIRNLWIYRRLIALIVLFGVAMGFVFSNREEVTVKFPLLGAIRSWSGIVMLVSAALGAVATWLVMTFRVTLREAREQSRHTDAGHAVDATEPSRQTASAQPASGEPERRQSGEQAEGAQGHLGGG